MSNNIDNLSNRRVVTIRALPKALAICSLVAGIALLLLNVVGLVVPLRAPEINDYVDFADTATLSFDTAMRRLEELATKRPANREFVTAATHIFHEGIAHVSPADVKENGLEHYGMRVPASENWVLFALSYLKPDTYRDYEFCSYERALERGTGRCGQQALALVSFLSQQGIETGFVQLGDSAAGNDHEVATAKVNDSTWYILDADYGAVIPFGVEKAQQDTAALLPYYWSSVARVNRIDKTYTNASVSYGGPEARFARACPIERAAYVAKWLVPALLVAAFPLLLFVSSVARSDQ